MLQQMSKAGIFNVYEAGVQMNKERDVLYYS